MTEPFATSLDGFQATFESASTSSATSMVTTTLTASGTPGFGVAAAVGGFVAAALLLRR